LPAGVLNAAEAVAFAWIVVVLCGAGTVDLGVGVKSCATPPNTKLAPIPFTTLQITANILSPKSSTQKSLLH
jgi:hypothetical protein